MRLFLACRISCFFKLPDIKHCWLWVIPMLIVPEHNLCTICWSTGNGCYILVQIIYFHYILWRSWEREFKILCKVLYRCSWLRAGRCVAPMHFIVNIRRHLWNETTIKRCKLIQPNSEQQEHNCGWKAALDLGWTPVDTAHVSCPHITSNYRTFSPKDTNLRNYLSLHFHYVLQF